MTDYKTKVIEIYTQIFINERKLAFSQRMKKSKKECIAYIEERIKNTENEIDLLYWETLNKYAKRL